MGSMILKILLCIAVPLLMLLGILEKRSRRIILSLMLGCFMCLIASKVNTYFCNRFSMSYFYLTTTFAPICEEVFKFIPIILYCLLFSHDKEQIVPAAFAVGIGFAIVENEYMLVQNSSDATVAWLIIRGIGAGLMHGMTTSIMGYGIFLALKDKRLIIVGIISSLFLAIMYHGAYNCLIQTEIIKYFGILLPGFTYLGLALVYYKDNIMKWLVQDKATTNN